MYEDKLDKITWSYSSVHSYDDCPFCFKLERIDRVSKVQNAFASWGTFMHSILESYFKGEADLFDLLDIYERGYAKNVPERFPYNQYCDLGERYYKAGLDYFEKFNGLSDNFTVLGVEMKTPTTMCGYPFIGYIDLVLENTKNGELWVVDHKSKSKFNSKDELAVYLRQLYLYATYVKEVFGTFPSTLMFNMVRAGATVKVEFDPASQRDAVDWFGRTIEKIYQDTTFYDRIYLDYERKFKDIDKFKPGSDFFCANICGAREHCPRSGRMKSKK